MALQRGDQLFQPVGVQLDVVVEQSDQLTLGGTHGDVESGSHANVRGPSAHNTDLGMLFAQINDGAVGGAIVNHHDLEVSVVLCCERGKHHLQQVTAVVIEDRN